MKAASGYHSFFLRLKEPEYILFLILLGTFVLRFAFLDLKLYHHDEAVHAWFAYKLLTEGTYVYDPMFHGPFLFYVTAGLFSLFGDSDLVGRLLPAALGTALVMLVYPLYRMGYLDARQMVVAAVFLAVSPNMVYFSRFLRNDIFIAFFSLLLIVAALAYFRSGGLSYALVAGAAAGLGMSSKENMPIILLIFGFYLLYAIWSRRLVFPPTWRRDILLAAALGGGVMALFYSSFGAHPEIVLKAGGMAIDHWMEMHQLQRLPGPWFFYLIFFILYETPIALLAALGLIQCLVVGLLSLRRSIAGSLEPLFDMIRGLFRRPEVGVSYDPQVEFFRFSVWWLLASLLVYAWIGEKVPWLILHQLLPMVFVAGYQLNRFKMAIAAAGVIILLGVSLHIAFTPADIAEPIVQVQNSEDLRELWVLIDRSDRVAIATSKVWPINWYYRGDRWAPITYYGGKSTEASLLAGNFDLIITYDAESYEQLPGYEKIRLKHSYWVSYHQVQGRLIEYFFTRQAPLGSMNYDIFIRQDP